MGGDPTREKPIVTPSLLQFSVSKMCYVRRVNLGCFEKIPQLYQPLRLGQAISQRKGCSPTPAIPSPSPDPTAPGASESFVFKVILQTRSTQGNTFVRFIKMKQL